MTADELGGLAEAAAWLGVQPDTVKMLRYRHRRPPQPPRTSFRGVEEPESTPRRLVYRRSKVEAWARANLRPLPGDQEDP